jgi:hypothetical protein
LTRRLWRRESLRRHGDKERGDRAKGDRARSEERGATGRDTVELKYPTKIRLKQKDESHIP